MPVIELFHWVSGSTWKLSTHAFSGGKTPRSTDGTKPNREYQTRLSYAREFTIDGELAYAEYLIRPLRHADRSNIANTLLLDELLSILDSELGETRLEDFESPPELIDFANQLRS